MNCFLGRYSSSTMTDSKVPAPCVASRLGNLFEVHKVLEDIRGAPWFAKFSSIAPGIGYERAMILPFPIRHNF